jgi:uncharacterized membrane protein YdcZ (DUF606 family)
MDGWVLALIVTSFAVGSSVLVAVLGVLIDKHADAAEEKSERKGAGR